MATEFADNSKNKIVAREVPLTAGVLTALLLLGGRSIERRAIRSLLPKGSPIRRKRKGRNGSSEGDDVSRSLKQALAFLDREDVLLRFSKTVLVTDRPAMLKLLKNLLSEWPCAILLAAHTLKQFSVIYPAPRPKQKVMKARLQALLEQRAPLTTPYLHLMGKPHRV